MKYFVFLYGAFELFAGIHNTWGQVAHFAHLGGMIGGAILIYLWRKKGGLSDRSSMNWQKLYKEYWQEGASLCASSSYIPSPTYSLG